MNESFQLQRRSRSEVFEIRDAQVVDGGEKTSLQGLLLERARGKKPKPSFRVQFRFVIEPEDRRCFADTGVQAMLVSRCLKAVEPGKHRAIWSVPHAHNQAGPQTPLPQLHLDAMILQKHAFDDDAFFARTSTERAG